MTPSEAQAQKKILFYIFVPHFDAILDSLLDLKSDKKSI